jgi:hypothetical protein
MKFIYDDGGRAASGFEGKAGDCVCRSIAIATGKDYADVYNDLLASAVTERTGKRKRGRSHPRTGVYKNTYRRYLAALGWTFHPTMQIGSGCKVHLAEGELPTTGRLIVCVSRHLTAVIDGNIHDTHDPRREDSLSFEPDRGQELKPNQGRNENGVWTKIGGRCVYGYFTKP